MGGELGASLKTWTSSAETGSGAPRAGFFVVCAFPQANVAQYAAPARIHLLTDPQRSPVQNPDERTLRVPDSDRFWTSLGATYK
jgi:hypothetical protein